MNDWTRRHFMAGTALALSQTGSAQAQHGGKALDMSADAVLTRRKEALGAKRHMNYDRGE